METPQALLEIFKVCILVSGCFLSFKGPACQLEGENKKNAKIFYAASSDRAAYDRVTKYNLSSYELKNCSTDVQLTKTVELPSPQNFSTESWLKETATASRHCAIESTTIPISKIFKDPSPEMAGLIKLSDDCVGLNVQETQAKAISMDLSKTCQVITKKSDSNLLLKGENCRISGKGLINLKIDWVILNSCKLWMDRGVDVNFRLRTSEVSRAKDNFSQPDIVVDKKMELIFETGSEQDPRYKLGDQTYTVRKSNVYQVDFDFLNLALTGSKYTQIRAKSEFLVQNQSRQKSPVVLNHGLFLVKNGNFGSPIDLSHWYSGAYLPPQWMGMDGLSETFNFGPSFDSFVLNENATKIQVGDIIVLKSEMVFPNRGPQRFVDFFNDHLKKRQKLNPQSSKVPSVHDDKIPEIKPIAGAGEIELIPEIDQSWSDPKVNAFSLTPLNPILYRTYCLNGDCQSFDSIEVMPEIRVAFQVEEAEIGIKIKPLQIFKRNFKNQIIKSDLNEMSRIKCF